MSALSECTNITFVLQKWVGIRFTLWRVTGYPPSMHMTHGPSFGTGFWCRNFDVEFGSDFYHRQFSAYIRQKSNADISAKAFGEKFAA